jgi:hypothetical protein
MFTDIGEGGTIAVWESTYNWTPGSSFACWQGAVAIGYPGIWWEWLAEITDL